MSDEDRQRRMIVAMAVTRGYGLFEIMEQLDKKGLAADEERIRQDILDLSIEWEQRAGQSTEQHMVAMLAEIREVKRTAWAMNDLGTVLKALAQEYGLLSRAAARDGGGAAGPVALGVRPEGGLYAGRMEEIQRKIEARSQNPEGRM